MRTKLAILAAAALAAGALTSQAQSNVYSLNVVGYYNLSLTNGFNLIANQLDLDGTGANNTLQSVFGTALPSGSQVYVFTGGIFIGHATVNASGLWNGTTNQANLTLQPGQGAFVKIPAAATTPVPLTIVGNVLQGTNLTVAYPVGYSIISSITPRSGGIQTVLGLTPSSGDFVYQWNPAIQNYGSKHVSNGTVWNAAGEPVPAIGEAFYYNAKVAKNWVQNFIVQ
jgi:hypothetical protein